MLNSFAYHYLLEDTLHLATNGVPIGLFGTQARAIEFLRASVETGDELKEILGNYPDVRYAPLDFHYACQQSIAALDVPLMDDLTSCCAWAGYAWGAFLTGLTHDIRYLPFLDARYGHFHRYQWLVDEVRSALTAQPDRPLSPFGTLLVRLRDQLTPLPRLPVLLHRAPATDAVEKKRAAVLAAYRKGDWNASLALARV
jgi:hypothetical protein